MVSNDLYSRLLATLYAAPLDNAHWQRFLQQLCDVTESDVGFFLVNESSRGIKMLALAGPEAALTSQESYNKSYAYKDPFRESFMRNPRIGLIEGSDLVPHEELVKTDLYREFLEPQQLHHMTSLVLSVSPRLHEVVTMWRGGDRPHLAPALSELLQLLLPHLQTALEIQRRLNAAEDRASSAEAVLDASTAASFVLDSAGRVLYTNSVGRRLIADGVSLTVRNERLMLNDFARQAQFRFLLTACVNLNQTSAGGALALDRMPGLRPLQLLVSPLRLEHISDARVLVLVTDPELGVRFPDTILRALYDLTPAETEIANGLLTGFSIDELAILRNVPLNTANAELNSLMSKTRSRRQSDLLRLLLTLPRVHP